MTGTGSKDYWNQVAESDPAWHIATKFRSLDSAFYESGEREVEYFLSIAGLSPGSGQSLLEIGCGAGRMTWALASRAGKVIASDVSPEMLKLAKEHLADRKNIEFLELTGDGKIPIPDESVDFVFSYITMQHVPAVEAQERYLTESVRVLRPGGRGLIQFRRSGLAPRVLDWVGHFAHALGGRRTLRAEWRGARVSRRRLEELTRNCKVSSFISTGRRHTWLSFEK
ncbi:MAG: class I SAM-dependent methyltransferase [Cryobacterium sp.]|nr:class I SAM-dependent methyltransferase [Cryobacterium sp.]